MESTLGIDEMESLQMLNFVWFSANDQDLNEMDVRIVQEQRRKSKWSKTFLYNSKGFDLIYTIYIGIRITLNYSSGASIIVSRLGFTLLDNFGELNKSAHE